MGEGPVTGYNRWSTLGARGEGGKSRLYVPSSGEGLESIAMRPSAGVKGGREFRRRTQRYIFFRSGDEGAVTAGKEGILSSPFQREEQLCTPFFLFLLSRRRRCRWGVAVKLVTVMKNCVSSLRKCILPAAVCTIDTHNRTGPDEY